MKYQLLLIDDRSPYEHYVVDPEAAAGEWLSDPDRPVDERLYLSPAGFFYLVCKNPSTGEETAVHMTNQGSEGWLLVNGHELPEQITERKWKEG